MKIKNIRLVKMNFLKIKLLFGTLFVTFVPSLSVFAADDPSAKSFSTYVLGDWVSPIFGVMIAFSVVKHFIDQDWIKGALLLVAGAVVYFFIKDPQTFLDTLNTIPKKFGF